MGVGTSMAFFWYKNVLFIPRKILPEVDVRVIEFSSNMFGSLTHKIHCSRIDSNVHQ